MTTEAKQYGWFDSLGLLPESGLNGDRSVTSIKNTSAYRQLVETHSLLHGEIVGVQASLVRIISSIGVGNFRTLVMNHACMPDHDLDRQITP